VRVRASQQGDGKVTFSVCDTGIGIAPEYQGRMFEDFSQVQSELQRKLKGTGLGLSLSKRLAELLGGSVALQSEVGKGSEFSVTIPIQWPVQK
jgi:signal transduction histidine kinase